MISYINSNMHSQAGAWERGRSPVGCCFQCTNNINMKKYIYTMPIFGALANSTLQEL